MKETEEMLELCMEKGLTSMIEVVTMDYINMAFERLEKNDVRYRFAVDVAGSKLSPWTKILFILKKNLRPSVNYYGYWVYTPWIETILLTWRAGFVLCSRAKLGLLGIWLHVSFFPWDGGFWYVSSRPSASLGLGEASGLGLLMALSKRGTVLTSWI